MTRRAFASGTTLPGPDGFRPQRDTGPIHVKKYLK